MPFPAEDEEEDRGNGDGGGPGRPGAGKGLSREQRQGLDMVKHIMLSLDEEDGLDEIYTFRFKYLFLTILAPFYCILSHFSPHFLNVFLNLAGMQLSSCVCLSVLRGDQWPGPVS